MACSKYMVCYMLRNRKNTIAFSGTNCMFAILTKILKYSKYKG